MGGEELKHKIDRIFNGVHTQEEKESISTLDKIDIDKNWDQLQSKLHVSTAKKKHSKNPGIYLLFRVAAILLVLITSSVVIYTFTTRTPDSVKQVASIHENTELVLNDGSKIIMKKGSNLTYPENYHRRKREVSLQGEAWFEITKAEKKPFYIYLEHATVKVLGTSFNIKTESKGNATVSVVSGTVSFFDNKNGKNTVTLEAGQQAVFNNATDNFEKVNFKDTNFIYWKTGRLIFKDTPLEEVFKVLEENYNAKIIVKENSVLRDKWTTTCENQSLEEILYELGELFGIEYTTDGDTVSIFRN